MKHNRTELSLLSKIVITLKNTKTLKWESQELNLLKTYTIPSAQKNF